MVEHLPAAAGVGSRSGNRPTTLPPTPAPRPWWTIAPRDVVLVDGILLFADARLRALFDIKIFVDVADDVRFIRRLQRDVEERGRTMDDVIRQYLSTVRPMHLEFVEPSKRHADVILPEGGHNRIGVEMILARVELELARRDSRVPRPA